MIPMLCMICIIALRIYFKKNTNYLIRIISSFVYTLTIWMVLSFSWNQTYFNMDAAFGITKMYVLTMWPWLLLADLFSDFFDLKHDWKKMILWHIFIIGVCSYGWAYSISHLLTDENPFFYTDSESFMGSIMGINLFLAIAIFMVYLGWRMHIAILHHFKEIQLVHEQSARLKTEAELQSLRAQMNPHFFFNVLNTLANLIETSPQKAEKIVEHLAMFFRFNLTMGDKLYHSFSDEWNAVEHYLALEKARLGDRLQIKTNFPADLKASIIPVFILQPLIENAIFYGVSSIPDGGVINVKGEIKDNCCNITITNPLPVTPPQSRGNGVAMDNIKRRLKKAYGPLATLNLALTNENALTTLMWPLKTANLKETI